MTDLTDRSSRPTLAALEQYVDNPLFSALCARLTEEYGARISLEYSGDQVLPGWNVRFYRAGRTLLRLYPRRGAVAVLVVVGPREKDRAEALLPGMSPAMQAVYAATREGMGQRWLLLELREEGPLYADTLALVRLRRTRQ